MDIYLTRHGETDWNREMKLQGWADISLNERGREQARRLAARLAGVRFDRAFCSDLDRAAETAEIVLGGRGPAVEPDPRLREMGSGPLEGEPYGDARTNPENPLHGMFVRPDLYKPPFGGEELSFVAARFDSFKKSTLEPLESDPSVRTVLIVAHGIIVREILTLAGGFQYEDFWKLPVGNCSIARLKLEGGKLTIAEMDEKVGHWLI